MIRPKLLIFLLILSPYFWWNISHFSEFIQPWFSLPSLIRRQSHQIFSADKIAPIEDMRWYSGNRQLGRLFFNKLDVIPDELMHGLKAISPPSIFNPSKDPLSLSPVLLPLAVVGLLALLRQKKYSFPLLLLSTVLIPPITGLAHPSLMFPSYLIYLILSAIGFSPQKKSTKIIFIVLLILHNFLIFGRHYLI